MLSLPLWSPAFDNEMFSSRNSVTAQWLQEELYWLFAFREALENHRDRISITLILKAALINSRMSYLDCISVPSSQMYTWSLSVPVTAVMLSHLALPREQRAAGCLCVELCWGDRAEGRKVGAGVGLWWNRAACASDYAGWAEALELTQG